MRIRKILTLSALAMCITGCGGGTTTGPAGDGNQNFVHDTSGKLIPGKVSLVLVDREKAEKSFEEYCKNKTLTDAEKEAYQFDINFMSSTKLCDIVYDTEKTGSYTYSFDMKRTIGHAFNGNDDIEVTKYKLAFYFSPSGSGLRKIVFSDYSSFTVKIEYTYNTGSGIRNISRTKTGTMNIYSDDYVLTDNRISNLM